MEQILELQRFLSRAVDRKLRNVFLSRSELDAMDERAVRSGLPKL
jgi:hypothetical protein